MDSGANGGPPDQQSGRLVREVVVPIAARVLGLRDAALYLALSPSTVVELEEAGIIRRIRTVGRHGREIRKRRYDRAQLDQLINGSSQ